MDDSVVILYNGEPVSVPKEVAEFLEQERKREQAQDKRDERHLSRSEFETVLSCLGNTDPPVEETAIQDLQLETLRKAVQTLDAQEQNLVALRYTAISRAKSKVILIGQRQAIYMAIHKHDVDKRNTALADRITVYYDREQQRPAS